jgi:hypothetical protein
MTSIFVFTVLLPLGCVLAFTMANQLMRRVTALRRDHQRVGKCRLYYLHSKDDFLAGRPDTAAP